MHRSPKIDFVSECEFREVDFSHDAYIEIFHGLNDVNECVRNCQKNTDCDLFLFATEKWPKPNEVGMCVLKSGPGDIVKQPGVMASYRTCKFP